MLRNTAVDYCTACSVAIFVVFLHIKGSFLVDGSYRLALLYCGPPPCSISWAISESLMAPVVLSKHKTKMHLSKASREVRLVESAKERQIGNVRIYSSTAKTVNRILIKI